MTTEAPAIKKSKARACAERVVDLLPDDLTDINAINHDRYLSALYRGCAHVTNYNGLADPELIPHVNAVNIYVDETLQARAS